MKTYEMHWDCAFCDTKKLLGKSHRFCPSCGGPQDPTKRYFPEDSDKVAVEDHKYVGVDLVCPGCSVAVSAACEHCSSCGSPMTGAKSVGLAAGPEPSTTSANVPETPNIGSSRVDKPQRRRMRPVAIVIAAVAVGVIGLFIADAASASKPTHVEVTGLPWTRTIAIERYTSVKKDGWCEDMPRDVYNVKRSQRERKERVEDGETCHDVNVDNGDGTFRQEPKCVPKYVERSHQDPYCNYATNEWRKLDSVKKEGDGKRGTKPVWPDVQVREQKILAVGAERITNRTATYGITVRDPSRPKATETCQVDERVWQAVAPGASVTVKRGGIFGGIKCDSLAAQAH